ncbi:hypothetical protein Tco_0058671 [Tanacetum coccineum]
MDDPNITMEEYIELEAEKARRHDFPAIVYKDALTPDHEFSFEPTLSAHRDDGIDFEFKISFDESDEEDYIVSYDKNSFSYKLTFVNDLKPDLDNDKVEIKISSEEIVIEPSDRVVDANVDAQSHEFKEIFETNHEIRHKSFIVEDYPKNFETLYGVFVIRIRRIILFGLPVSSQYSISIIRRIGIHLYGVLNLKLSILRIDYLLDTRLGTIFDRWVNRVHVLDFEELTDEMRQALTDRLRMVHLGAEGQILFTSDAWRRVFEIGGPLVLELMLEFFSTIASDGDLLGVVPSYTSIWDPLRRLCHRLISGRGQAPEKVTAIEIFYLRNNGVNTLKSIDEGPFKMGKFIETLAEGALHLGPERDRVFADLMPEERERFKADIHAMNILLQGLPKDIYTLINNYTDAKDIWDNVKMLLEGSELTKDKRKSQLYGEFENFRQNK